MKKTIVIGLGNLLMSDEGVGVHIIRRLAERAAPHPDVRLLDAGAAGFGLLHAIAGYARLVLVDCAFMHAPPGTLRMFQPGDVISCKELAGFSLHEGDLLTVLDLSRRMGECPPDVTIAGIQPADVAPGTELSPTLRSRLDEYAAAVARLVGIPVPDCL